MMSESVVVNFLPTRMVQSLRSFANSLVSKPSCLSSSYSLKTVSHIVQSDSGPTPSSCLSLSSCKRACLSDPASTFMSFSLWNRTSPASVTPCFTLPMPARAPTISWIFVILRSVLVPTFLRHVLYSSTSSLRLPFGQTDEKMTSTSSFRKFGETFRRSVSSRSLKKSLLSKPVAVPYSLKTVSQAVQSASGPSAAIAASPADPRFAARSAADSPPSSSPCTAFPVCAPVYVLLSSWKRTASAFVPVTLRPSLARAPITLCTSLVETSFFLAMILMASLNCSRLIFREPLGHTFAKTRSHSFCGNFRVKILESLRILRNSFPSRPLLLASYSFTTVSTSSQGPSSGPPAAPAGAGFEPP
mmetsp:Transcript_1097/g.3124  ORF Transcript_1097/g.3124 Transcript_1097/m.3124 type:complete len:359 (+) Transcript_1097:807-1883(+)